MIQPEKDEKEPNQDELLKLLDRREASVKAKQKSQQASEEYLEFFNDLSQQAMTKDTLIQKLRQSNIRYEGWKNANQYCIRIVKSACDSQIVTLEVSIGPFVLLVNLCNCSTKNYTHFLQGKTSTFATIYDYNVNQSRAIIKCTTFKPKDFLDTLIVVMKEYAFFKIAAVLDVGPQIMPIFGFDLLVFEDCIEFSMEKCEPLFGIDENIVKTLKEKLLILHKLKILHIDIKPQNFCHSPLLNQPIFIDFGLSQVIQQQPGELTDTSFMGSLNYCSPEMTKLYYQSNNGPVDLYMNDVICMKKSFKEMTQQRQKSQKVNFLKEEEFIDSESSEGEIDAYPSTTESKKVAINFILLKIKSFIYCEEDMASWYERYEPYLIRLKDNILVFIQNLSYSEFLGELSEKLLSYNKFDRFLCYNFIHRLEKKGNLVKSSNGSNQASEDHNENPPSPAYTRMSQIGEALTIKSIYLSKKELQPQMNNNVFLETPQLIFKADKSLLFHKFMQFSDIRTVFTTNTKRLKVAKLLIAHLKLPKPENGQITDFLCVCWRHILYLELQSPNKHYHSNIAIAVHNLMIVEGLSLQEYFQIFHQVGKLEIQPIKKCELLYMCATSSVWQVNRFSSKYDSFEIVAVKNKTFIFQLDQLKALIPPKLSEIVLFLVVDGADFCDLNISYPYQEQLQYMANLLSFEVYEDCRKNLKSSLIRQRYRTGAIIRVKQLYQLINSQSNHRFDYYYFYIFDSCQKGGHRSIKLNIFNFISRCWEGIDLFPKYRIYHHVIMDIQKLSKKINKEYYEMLLAKEIKVERIYDNYTIFYVLFTFMSSKYTQTPQVQHILNKIKQIVNHSFMLQLINSDQSRHQMIFIYEIYSFCFIIYITLYQKQSGYRQKIQEIIQQFSKKWQTLDKRVQASTIVSVCIMIGTALQSIGKQQISIEFQICFTSIHYSQISKTNLIIVVDKICQVIHTSKIQFSTRYNDFVYSALRYINRPKKIIEGNFLMLFTEISYHLLANRKDPSYFLDLHMGIWKEMQRDFKDQNMTAYFHRCYLFFLRYPEQCAQLADRIKLLPLSFFKGLERYNCACVLVLLLILEKKYDAISLRMLVLISQTLPRLQRYAHSAIQNILYSYFINREVSVLSQNRTAFKAPFHDIVPQLLDYRTRKIMCWARKVVKLTNVNNNQQKAYNNVLITNYDKRSNFCLLFERFLRRPYQHQRYS